MKAGSKVPLVPSSLESARPGIPLTTTASVNKKRCLTQGNLSAGALRGTKTTKINVRGVAVQLPTNRPGSFNLIPLTALDRRTMERRATPGKTIDLETTMAAGGRTATKGNGEAHRLTEAKK